MDKSVEYEVGSSVAVLLMHSPPIRALVCLKKVNLNLLRVHQLQEVDYNVGHCG